MLGLVILLSAAGAAGPLPPYAESIRCAGLAEAESKRHKPMSAEGRRLYDAALFWGLAASEAARKDKRTAKVFTADQRRAAARAKRELRSEGRAAKAELDACLARVPPLNP
jgi:hypothetical protein